MVSLMMWQSAATTANPIRKVVDLLQGLSKQVDQDTAIAKKMYEKYMCYCDKNEKSLTTSIDDGKDHVSQLGSTIEALTGSNAKLQAEIEDISGALSENEKALESAAGVRRREQREYEDAAAEMKNSIRALKEAIPKLKAGFESGASFAQVGASAQELLLELPKAGRQDLQALFQQGESGVFKNGNEATGSSAQVIGMMDQMLENFEKNLHDAMETEKESQQAFNQLDQAKSQEISAAKSELKDKKARLAKQREELAEAQEDREDTILAVDADESFLSTLTADCKQTKTDYEAQSKARSVEAEGIQQAISFLNSDEALETFKKTLPDASGIDDASFVQMSMRLQTQRKAEALRILAHVPEPYRKPLSLITMSLRLTQHGKFDAVLKMINSMIARTKEEQHREEKKVTWCKGEIDRADQKKSDKQTTLQEYQQRSSESQQLQESLAEEVKELSNEIEELDHSAADATKQRQAENQVYQTTSAETSQAIELLQKAKTVLGNMYHKAGKSLLQQHAEETRDVRDLADGDDQDSQDAPASFLQARMTTKMHMKTKAGMRLKTKMKDGSELDQEMGELDQIMQPEKPKYEKKSGQGNGIVAILENLITDTKEEYAVMQKEEQEAQTTYEKLLEDIKAARESTVKDIADREEDKATEEQTVQELANDIDDVNSEISAVTDKLHSLHDTCDWISNNLEQRTKARDEVIESLSKSVSVLNGMK